jgi:hypothetical protein
LTVLDLTLHRDKTVLELVGVDSRSKVQDDFASTSLYPSSFARVGLRGIAWDDTLAFVPMYADGLLDLATCFSPQTYNSRP